jgi:transposase
MPPQGMSRVADLLAALLGEDEATLPPPARQALRGLAAELEALGTRVEEIDAAIIAWHKDSEASRRLAAVPGIGLITASAIVATVGDVSTPRRGTSQPGLASCRSRTAPEASRARAASPRPATATCVAYWCSGRPR